MKAVSLDIGWMRNIGVIAENFDYQLHRKSAANKGMIEDAELMAFLDVYCNPRLPILGPDKSQLLAGVITPGDMIAAGNTPPRDPPGPHAQWLCPSWRIQTSGGYW